MDLVRNLGCLCVPVVDGHRSYNINANGKSFDNTAILNNFSISIS